MAEYYLDTVVIGGGQAGLAIGYYLKEREQNFAILDASDQMGETWRRRWDSLRLFTPAIHSALPGIPFPALQGYYPSKDEMADYLQRYAGKFGLPMHLHRRVDSLVLSNGGYRLSAGDECYVARQVVVATGPYYTPRIPDFASRLDPSIVQIHSSTYRNPDQLPAGAVLVVGAGNSGAEIAVEIAATRPTFLSGRSTGRIPAAFFRNRLFWWLISHLAVDTPIGRILKKKLSKRGTPLIRLKPKDIARAGVERVPRTESVIEGRPKLADGQVLEVTTIIWATGFKPAFDWIKLPIFGVDGYPIHHRGIVDAAPGLYFLGLPFQHTLISDVIGGVGQDACYIADHIVGRMERRKTGVAP